MSVYPEELSEKKRETVMSGNASARSGPASRLGSFTDLTEKAAGNRRLSRSAR
ncbi:hypothetical protein [Lysobacter sp. 1R34A]|uniref:hypothetical protein n=1 Tax=Lysobacter sp. 1R34A TaxID=3445786 RepID=UPI003EEDEDB4